MKIKIPLSEMLESWEPISGLSHLLAAFIALFGMTILNYQAARVGNYPSMWANPFYWTTSLFMFSMVTLYSASAVYHIIPLRGAWKKLLRRFDQAMIFFLIAGTCTPICVNVFPRQGGYIFLAVIWLIAVAGMVIKIGDLPFPDKYSSLIYLGMGWGGGYFMGPPVREHLGTNAYYWLVAGGISYSVGAFFYWFGYKYDPNDEKWYHEIFHGLVMAGSSCHYGLMLVYVLKM